MNGISMSFFNVCGCIGKCGWGVVKLLFLKGVNFVYNFVYCIWWEGI